MKGWLRTDGRKGIRNTILVAYTVECAHHICTRIVQDCAHLDAQVIGFSGCFPSDYGQDMMSALCTHPNVGAVLLVSLGCENFRKSDLMRQVKASGRPVHLITIQQVGGTRSAIAQGRDWVKEQRRALDTLPKVPMSASDFVIGTICGGSDATSGLTGNPPAGRAFDRFVSEGATCIFEETGELIGCEHIMAARAATPALKDELVSTVEKAAFYYAALGYGSFSQGNATGGLSTIEEKSLGAYAKSGDSQISGIIRPAQCPDTEGLYLLDVVPEGAPQFGFPNINDTAEIIELISCGAHAVIFVTGRGSVVGSAISPVLKVCANPQTYERMAEDMDVNAGRILTGEASLNEVGDEIYGKLLSLADGGTTASEDLGHREFVLTYKNPDHANPSCHTAA